MAKMSSKEFKAVLKQAGMDFEFWGYEGILNIMSLFYSHKSKEEEIEGFLTCSEESREKADIIYDYLDSKGFYN